jgi:N-acetyl-alpha-D-muramate 1-phosphate uridylyltransferase
MTQMIGHTAMMLAAGLGTRMRPLTDITPKPLINVLGKPIIDYGYERLREAHVAKVVVNAHYLPDQIVKWASQKTHPTVEVSDEADAILDTGGGIARALPLLGNDPFFVLNSDSFWVDVGEPALQRLQAAWHDDMECLLLLCDPKNTTGYDGTGDFVIGEDGRLQRFSQSHAKAYVYIGGYLVHPKLFENAPNDKFSMNMLFDKALKRKSLFGLVHNGHWLHVGTPEAILDAEQFLQRT